MMTDELHETETSELYELIARATGDDVEAIASLGFELYTWITEPDEPSEDASNTETSGEE